MTDGEIAAKMETIETTYLWKVNLFVSRLEPLSCKEKDAIDVSVARKGDKFYVNYDNESRIHVAVQRMKKSALHIYEKLRRNAVLELYWKPK